MLISLLPPSQKTEQKRREEKAAVPVCLYSVMKAWTRSKAVPSPSPPPLMRFLRSTTSSRSRGRSSRPTASVFARRKRSTAIDAHQEPSSPKVTCIGQVRVRRSCKPKHPNNKKRPRKRKPTSDAAGSRFCCRAGCFRPPWRKWVSFFRCRKFWVRTNSVRKESIPTMDRDSGEEEERREHRKWCPGESESSGNPPKNVLIMARCRSAPHRSSYLASRLWGSPLKAEEEKTEHENSTAVEDKEKKMNSYFLEIEQIRENPAPESELKVNAEIFKHEANFTVATPRTPNQNSVEVEKTGVLRRSKSEPGRRSGDPLSTSFWTETTLESLFLSSTYSVDHK